MQLTCNKCKHQWEEEVAAGQPVVMCPECMAIVPMVLAQKKAAAAPEKPPERPVTETKIRSDLPKPPPIEDRVSPTPSTPPPSARGRVEDIHELKTIRTPPAAEEKPAAPPPRRAETPRPPAPPSAPPQAAGGELPVVPKTPPPSSDVPTTPVWAEARHRPTVGAGALDTAELEQLIGKTLEGYRVEQLLGRGGMGVVYVAHQISLDRKVALKVLPSRYSQDPELMARFTREALSAAQLNHHNIVQVYDVGSVGDVNFISMEYVRGKNIGDMIRNEGRLQVDDAAAYILQVARGLKYAHERGIIHRDIKPDNLMINEHGIVKIADMGLAKWRKDVEATSTTAWDSEALLKQPQMDLTVGKATMGTPAYMSPEQCQDASSVDERADQYSLGCTLYYMCAGKAPYSGTTAFELMSKHLKEPLTPLEVHVQGVPPVFSEIIKRMLEKSPEDRYSDMGEVIRDLETYLGVESEKGPYTPREYHLALLDQKQKEYYAAPSIKKRQMAQLGFFALMALCFVLAFAGGDFALAGGFLGILALTPVANFVLNGIITKEYLFRRVRSVFFGMQSRSWLILIASSIGAAVVLYLLGWLYYWLPFVFVAGGLAAAYQTLVLKRLRTERLAPINVVHDMLKQLRVRGVSEEALHDFVCRFSGVQWEEFFEELFGYEDMIIARVKWAAADKVKPRKKFAVWREPLARWLENLEQARKVAREKRQLTKAEARRLRAKGVSEQEAERTAEIEATRIIESGLIRQVPAEKPVRKPILRLGKHLRLAGKVGFRAACFVGGLAVMAAALAAALPRHGVNISALGKILSYVPTSYYSQWGWGGTEVAAGAGLFLLLMAFASRPALRIVVWIGVILLLFKAPIIHLVNQPQLTAFRVFYGGVGLVLFGFGYSLIQLLNRRKF